jgi:signal transduction histidine kinase
MKALSPNPDESVIAGSRVAGLLDTRRWLLVLLLSEAWLFAALVGAAHWRVIASTDRLALVGSALCVVVGWTLSRRTIGVWLIMGAPLLLLLATLTNGGTPSEVKWIAVSTSAGHVAYALVMLTGPVLGFVSVIGCTVALAISWSMRPGNVVPGALVVADGWISYTLLAVSALTLWFAWQVLLRRAKSEDDSRARLAARIQAEQEVQERSRMWRAAAVSVHERLLSTLRYLLQTPEPDREGLRTLIAEAGAVELGTAPADLERSVRIATAARVAAGIVKLDPSIIDLPVSDEVRAAGRAAIVECALNAVLHGSATEVVVTGEIDHGLVRIRVTDNGSGIPDDATPGLGWSSVLDTGLSAVDGSWTVSSEPGSTVVELALPAATTPTTAAILDDGFAQGRTLLSAPLLAVGGVGVAFDVLSMGTTFIGVVAIAITIAAVLIGARFIQQGKRPDVRLSFVALLALAITPWLATYGMPQSISVQQLAPGMVTAGYAIIAIALWSRRWQFVSALAIWAAGMLALATDTAASERQPLVIGIVNCLVIVPVVVIVVSAATRRFRRAQDALVLQRAAMNTEVVRANAASVIDNQLSACVAQAEAIIARIADGAEVDAETRHELSCLEGLIRATIQVDPLSSGEFARVAARLCNSAFSSSIPAQVGTLISSADTAPLPLELVQALESSITSADSVTVRAMTVADEDHLSVFLHGSSVDVRAIESISPAALQGVDVDTESEPGTGVLVLVGRSH